MRPLIDRAEFYSACGDRTRVLRRHQLWTSSLRKACQRFRHPPQARTHVTTVLSPKYEVYGGCGAGAKGVRHDTLQQLRLDLKIP
jgi:hypothetical protein